MPPTYDGAWQAYRAAVDTLYQHDDSDAERAGRRILADADLEARADGMIDRSEELGTAAEAGLASGDTAVRELAEAQLIAAAAMDLMIADDLAQADEDGAAERSSGIPLAELYEILDTPQQDGITALLDSDHTRERSHSTGEPRSTALAATDTALEDILDDAGAAAAALTTSLLEIPALPLQQAGAAVSHELLQRLGEKVSLVLRKAVALVVKAIDKLAKALGQTARDTARQEAADWLQRLKQGEVLRSLLSMLYEPQRISAEVEQLVDTAPDDEQALREVSARLNGLGVRFAKHRKVLEWLARGLALVRNWLLGLQPWGPIALVSAHATAIGYVVYLGGDYVDWYRTGRSERLDFVPGIRTVVRESMVVATP